MDNKFPAGAYVISNKHHMTVLHAPKIDVADPWSPVELFDRDENRYRNHQLWWVEPLPLEEDAGDYSITHIYTGWALDTEMGCWGRVGKQLVATRPDGRERQRWRIQRFREDSDGVFYNIINSSDETMLDTTTDTRRPPLQTWHPKPENVAQRWEFIPPVVAVPPGWVQIQNASTGRVLSHKYLSQQPVLIAPSALQPFHYRESWETQWLFEIQHGQVGPRYDRPERTAWVIKNRLTGAILTQHDLKGTDCSVSALDRRCWRIQSMIDRWYPEIDGEGAWIIRNGVTSCLLEESTKRRRIGYELKCDEKTVRGDKTKIWNFVDVGNRARIEGEIFTVDENSEDDESVASSSGSYALMTPATSTTAVD